MPSATNLQTDFRGGFWSPSSQGRMDDPEYKRALSVCFNAYPLSSGPWVRRPSFRAIGYTRFGQPAKLLPLSGVTKHAYNMEISSGHLRFVHGAVLVTDASQVAISDVTTDNPAVWTSAAPHGWLTGDQMILSVPDPTVRIAFAIALNRVFKLEVVSPTKFILHDLLTDIGLNGANFAWSPAFVVNISRVTDVVTPYYGDTWRSVKRVQTDVNTFLLHPAFWPRTLTYKEASEDTWVNPQVQKALFRDGPYLDAQKNSIATPDAVKGIVNFTFSYAAYDAAVAYSIGDYVTDSGLNYRSIADQNIGNAPADPSLFWVRSSSLDFMPKKAFSSTDVGRHVRLFSEPAEWDVGTTYPDGAVVSFKTAQTAAPSYWMCIAAGTIGAGSMQPGGGVDKWVPYASGARWTWGKVVSVSSGTKITGTPFGNMTEGAGLAALFDGAVDTTDTACGRHTGVSAYVGLHAGGATAVTGARLFPARNAALAGGGTGGGPGVGIFGGASLLPGNIGYSGSGIHLPIVNPNPNPISIGGSAGSYSYALGQVATVTVNLRAKATLPGSASDGTLLGTSGTLPYASITGAPIHIASNNGTTTYNYVWLEVIITPVTTSGGLTGLSALLQRLLPGLFGGATATTAVVASEAEFYSVGMGGSGVAVQILGDPLLYNAAIRTWLLGLFNDTDPTYPTSGCFHEGRLWLGVGKNQFVASVSDGTDYLNFAPTKPDGTVTDASALNYKFNSEVNAPILWMLPGDGGIVLGMSGGERLLFSTTQNQSITPTNVNVELKTSYSSADIEPAVAPLTSLFVHSDGREVLEYMRDAYSGRFIIPPLTDNSKSLTESSVVQIAYQRNITSILWACTADGRLIGSTYERRYLPFRSESPPTYNGWHEHAHGAPRNFISVSVGPALDGSPAEVLACITQDKQKGWHRIEIASDLMPEDNDIYDCDYLDGMLVPTAGGTAFAQSDTVDGGGTPPSPPPPPPPPPGDPFGCTGIHPGFYRTGSFGPAIDRTVKLYWYPDGTSFAVPTGGHGVLTMVVYGVGGYITGNYAVIGVSATPADCGVTAGIFLNDGYPLPNNTDGSFAVILIDHIYPSTPFHGLIVESWAACHTKPFDAYTEA